MRGLTEAAGEGRRDEMHHWGQRKAVVPPRMLARDSRARAYWIVDGIVIQLKGVDVDLGVRKRLVEVSRSSKLLYSRGWTLATSLQRVQRVSKEL